MNISNVTIKKLTDYIIMAIVVSGLIIIAISIHSFMFPRNTEFSLVQGFRDRLLWLMVSVFMTSVITAIAVSFVLLATRRLRDE